MQVDWTCLDTTLHFTVVDAPPWAPGEMSRALAERVRRTAGARDAWRALLTKRAAQRNDGRAVDDAVLFDVYGPFDFAALYVSPELAPPPIGDGVGGHVNVTLLLKPSHGTEHATLDEAYVEQLTRGSSEKFAHTPFLAFIKCKINPSVLCSRAASAPDLAGVGDRHGAAVHEIWTRVGAWTAPTPAESRPLRHAAVGLSIGWNDVAVVAHAAAPGDLLRLVDAIRGATMPAEAYGQPEAVAHVCSTTVTTFGCLTSVRKEAERRAEELESSAHSAGDTPASMLFEASTKSFAGSLVSPSTCDGYRPFLRPAFHAYPGHERVIHDRLAEARRALPPRAEADLRETALTSTFEAGKHDVVGFPVFFDWFDDPRQAVAFVSLLHAWTSVGRLSPARTSKKGTPAHFDVHTHFGGVASSSAGTPLPKKHVEGGLPEVFEIPAFTLDREFHAPLLKDIVRETRELQLPFALSEQIRNMANRFVWAWNEVISRDEMVDLAPLVVGMRNRLVDATTKLRDISSRIRLGSRDVTTAPVWAANVPSESELWTKVAEGDLAALQFDCEQLVRAFRINLGNRHHAGYWSEDIVDLNVPFRGALHQLLAVTGMAADALLRTLLPSAPLCTSIFGPTVVTTMRCGAALLVRMSPWMLTFPLQLEVLGHEIAHAFLHEVVRHGRDAASSSELAPSTLSAAWGRCVDEVRRLDVDLYDGMLSEAEFAETICDWLEAALIGHLPVEPELDAEKRADALRSWTRSAFMRHVLQDATALTVDLELAPTGSPGGASQLCVFPRGDGFRRALSRAVQVWCLEELVATPPDEIDEFVGTRAGGGRRDVALGRLHKCLRDECLTGSSGLRDRLLADPPTWARYVHGEVFARAEIPWATDIRYARLVRKAAVALRAYVGDARSASTETWPGQIAAALRGAMRSLRSDVLDTMSPAVLFSSVLSEQELRGSKEDGATGSVPARELRRVPQPFSAVDSLPPAALINVRGGVIAGTAELESRWCRAHAEFYRALMPMVPFWRQQVLVDLRERTLSGRKSTP